MPLRVLSMFQYLTGWDGIEARERDYLTLMVVKAVKGRPPGGQPKSLKFKGTTYSFGPRRPKPAVEMWTAWAADRLQHEAPDIQAVIVPVPNSTAVHGSTADFRTADLARQIAAAVGPRITVATELRWDQEMEPASKGGPRFARLLYPHLVAEPSSAEGIRILLDDVLTTGGHLIACAAKLKEIGHDPRFALCCGRTSSEQLENPYAVPMEELPDFDPTDPFGYRDLFLDDPD